MYLYQPSPRRPSLRTSKDFNYEMSGKFSVHVFSATFIDGLFFIQLSPPPEQPLYLVAHHLVFMYLHEYSDLEDLGLDDAIEAGVKCILSDAIHVWPRPLDTFLLRSDDRYPWQNYSR